jgi:hypothetical protein
MLARPCWSGADSALLFHAACARWMGSSLRVLLFAAARARTAFVAAARVCTVRESGIAAWCAEDEAAQRGDRPRADRDRAAADPASARASQHARRADVGALDQPHDSGHEPEPAPVALPVRC